MDDANDVAGMRRSRPAKHAEAQGTPEFEALLEFLHRVRGFDFTGYKRTGLVRRVEKRMQAVGVHSFPEYQDYLEVHPDEFALLFDTVLINVTAFFRDPETWAYVRDIVVPHIVATRGDGPIRVWSAATASGEEAYTLAMIFGEALGLAASRERLKIYATDVDEAVLAKARSATYTEREMRDVPQELVARYFEPVPAGFAFRTDLRRQVIFGRHDLLQDAPISRVDLLTCRNSLMYFNAESQARIIERFRFALNPAGVLVLGRAETLLAHTDSFTPIDQKRRVYAKTGAPGERVVLPLQAAPGGGLQVADADHRLREYASDANPVAQVVVDARGVVAMVNERARTQFALTASAVGRPLQDLQLSYRPVELRSRIEQAHEERRPVVVRGVEWSADPDDVRVHDVSVIPIVGASGEILGTSIAFPDVTVAQGLQREVEQAHAEIETAYEELQSTNEELETTNEELQSTVEELETTNEELQSTNEELETMNEELQLANEELQTMNEELRERSDALNDANAFLASILGSLAAGVVVLDRELRVLSWNRTAEELWGLRAEEVVGRPFLGLDIGLPVDSLAEQVAAAAAGDGDQEVTLDAVNRRGAPVRCVVRCMPLLGGAGTSQGAIVTMDVEARPGGGNGGPGRRVAPAARGAKRRG